MNDDSRENCSKALAALDSSLGKRPDGLQRGLEQALCCLVQVRDGYIEQERSVPGCARDRLKRVNAILSMVVCSEYPVSGIRKENITKARDELARLLDEVHGVFC